jgi:hypothetical protein
MGIDNMPSQEQDADDLPDGFDKKLAELQAQKEDFPSRFAGTENDLLDMSEGGDGDGIRQEYYPGWTDGHFKKLLEELDAE